MATTNGKAAAKHTPGPWEAQTSIDPNIGTLPERWEVVHANDDGSMRYVAQTFGYESSLRFENEANARLMAAAPDLLAALEAMVACADGEDMDADPIDAARAALAKARP